MKHLLLTTIAAVVLVGCGNPEADRALYKAAGNGNIEVVKQHLAAGANVNPKFVNGVTPLHRVASNGHKEIVELLIANGADVNAKDKDGWTPLYRAIKDHDHKEIVELLLAKGADVNAKTNEGYTPLDRAIQRKNIETADLLRKHGAKSGAEDSILIAAMVGNIVAVKKHLSDGADVNAMTKYSRNTPLDLAIQLDQTEIADLLRKHGGMMAQELRSGMSPLHAAAGKGLKEVVELLIDKGANVNARKSGKYKGETPLDIAIEFNHTELADLLRKHGGKTSEELKAEGK